jgi:adenine-specific DNA-methyltransferase
MTDSHIESTVSQPAPTEQPERMDLQSDDIVSDKQAEIVRLFPEVRTEGGKIDFDRLRRVLGETVDPGKERYGMNWPGKADCLKAVQSPSLGTLVPSREESVDFDTTRNLVIEGDNLEVLKLMQKAYLSKIKMIYIDPPYNTGSDFIYPDDYSESLDTYLRYTEQVNSENRPFSTNTESNGRFHSKWLSMMYPRLYVSRNLLKDNGVIFISIGEKELANLEKVCNEIFGEENQVSIIARVAKNASDLGSFFAPSIDFVLCYAKNVDELGMFIDEVDESLYKKVEQTGSRAGEKYRDDVALYQSSQTDIRKNQKYFIECPDGSLVVPPCKLLDEVQLPGDGRWRWSKEKYLRDKNLLVFKRTGTSPLLDGNGQKAQWNIYTKSYLKDRQETGTRPRNYLDEFINRKGADLLKKFGIEFSFSKPIELMKYFMDIINPSDEDIVLDFFAGSGSTAHAVLERNRKSSGQLNFIMVQLPEPLDEGTRQANQGFTTVADICKERIRRVIAKFKKEQENMLPINQGTFQDMGFKVFKLAESNFKVWNAQIQQGDVSALSTQLDLGVHHIREGRTGEEILQELLVKSGFPLTARIENIILHGKTVYSVSNGAMFICLEANVSLELIRAISDRKPERVVFLDEGFAGNDQLKANAVQIMKSKGVTSFRTV